MSSNDPIITNYVDEHFQEDLELWNKINTTD